MERISSVNAARNSYAQYEVNNDVKNYQTSSIDLSNGESDTVEFSSKLGEIGKSALNSVCPEINTTKDTINDAAKTKAGQTALTVAGTTAAAAGGFAAGICLGALGGPFTALGLGIGLAIEAGYAANKAITNSFKNDEAAAEETESYETAQNETETAEEAESVKEISSQNADFYIDTEYEGSMNWGQKNTDGTYTIYTQAVVQGSEPQAVETITYNEAVEKGYIELPIEY